MTILIVGYIDGIAGWHVNTTQQLDGYTDISPSSPDVEFDGVKTFYYRFASEDDGKSALNWTENAGYQPIFVEPKVVPQSITRRQARQQLLLMGLLDNVDPTIAAIPDETARRMAEIYWQDATDFERDSAFLLSIAEALGLDADALDDAFIAAGAL